MSHRIVEIVIGRLVTDEHFRLRFVADARSVLREVCDQGFALSRTEMSALLDTPPALWLEAADRIDGRLQKASFEHEPALIETIVRSSDAASENPESPMPERLLTRTPSVPKLASRALLQRFGIHPADPDAVALDMRGTRALCVATNHGVLDIGVATGVFGSELTVPYYAFLDAGMEVDLASPLGGIIPVDPLSMKEAIRTRDDDRLIGDDTFRGKLMHSLAVADIDVTAYDIVYFAGGWGAAFDLGQSDVVGAKVSEAWAAGRVIGGICHGPLGLLRARTPDGEPLVKGRRLTAVTDKQIRELGIEITPLHPETALRQAGALFEGRAHPARDFFANHFVADGDLITGQNQNAGPMVARLMMQRVLAKRTPAQRRAS